MYENFIVIIPTYNECENINSLINMLDSHGFHIVIVDDNSPDKTFDIVKNHNKFGLNLFGILRTSDKGYGNSVKEGFRFALKNNYKYAIQMDSDFSHRVEDLLKMCGLAKNYDLVIGSRYVTGGGTTGWPKRRQYLSKYANKLSGLVFKSEIKDQTSGFRLMNIKVVEEILNYNPKLNGYAFLVEITNFIEKKNFRIKEVPIVFQDRFYGTSKMNYQIILEAIVFLFKKVVKKYI